MKLLFALFILLPLAELYLLIEVGAGIGGFSTIFLCLLTAAIGGVLVRLQGMQTLFRARAMMDQGDLPAEQVLHGMMIAAAGVLLFIPGFITDIIGFLLLIPMIRRLIGKRMMIYHRHHQVIIDAEVIHPDEKHLP